MRLYQADIVSAPFLGILGEEETMVKASLTFFVHVVDLSLFLGSKSNLGVDCRTPRIQENTFSQTTFV